MHHFIAPIASWAATPAVRSAVNSAFLGFARHRVARLNAADAVAVQRRVLRRLAARARGTRFGRDHGFATIKTVEDYQRRVPLRTYEKLWGDYLRDQYPIFENLTWPGRTPYLALTSGTTQGATKYIPVSREMVASNARASLTTLAFHMAHRPESKLFHGRMFFLGGTTDLGCPGPGVREGDLSAIASLEIAEWLRPYTFPPLDLAHETNWESKLSRLATQSVRERITLVGGVPSWLLVLFERLLALTGKRVMAEVWPNLEVIIHGGVKFDPYRASFAEIVGSDQVRLQETYPSSEGFIAFGDPRTELLRLVFDHGIFYEFVPVDELDAERPTRHWLGNAQTGVNYAIVLTTCSGLWSHVVGDTVRFESLKPPLLTFTGRTKYTLSAFGEHLINEEVEWAVAAAAEATGATVREWHVGPVFRGALGHHVFVFEFLKPPNDLDDFRRLLDRDLCLRNADYQAHRAEGVGLPLPALVVARPGGFDDWMRSRGKLGGQNKVPRMDSAGTLTQQIVTFLRENSDVVEELPAGAAP